VRTGAVVKRITAPSGDPHVHAVSVSDDPFTVRASTLWVGSADDLVKIDTHGSGREIDRIALDEATGGRRLTEGVTVGAGSIRVSRDAAGGQILRLNPQTGGITQR